MEIDLKEFELTIIRPQRSIYSPKELPSGNQHFSRKDIQLVNKRGLTIECSLYSPVKRPKKLPCIIYCHGHSGCRLDAIECIREMISMNFMVFAFDFSGSGLSEGEFVSLGYYEKEDIAVIVEYLLSEKITTRIGLWGRSMGAVTSLLYGSMDPSISCLVLDSPFSSLKKLGLDIVCSNSNIPRVVAKLGYKKIRKDIKKLANFDMDKVNVKKAASLCTMPAIFIHGEEDDFVNPSHSKTLYKHYKGEKKILLVEGGHNDVRPNFAMDSISIFLRNHLVHESDFRKRNSLPNNQSIDDYFSANDSINDFNTLFLDDIYLMDNSLFNNNVNQDSEEEILNKVIEMSLQDSIINDDSTKLIIDDEPSSSIDKKPVKKKKKKNKKKKTKSDKKRQSD